MYTLLYVDDEPGLLQICRAFLEQDPQYTVLTMTSAAAALAYLAGNRVDAVISDYQMPVMNGIAFLKELRSRRDATPFIIFTGRGREEVVIQAFDAGADSYLQKGGDPVAQFAELAQKIRQAVELRKAEEARVKSEEKYRALFNDSAIGIFRTTPDGTYLALNPAFARTYGYETPEEMQAEITDIAGQLYVRPSDRAEIVRLLETTGEIKGFVAENRHRLGHSIWISINARKVVQAPDGASYYEGTIEDITERKKAEKAKNEIDERFHRLLANSPDILFRISVPDGVYEYISPAVEVYSGYPPEAYYENPLLIRQIVHPDWVPYFDRMWERLINGDVPPSYEFQILTRNGEARWVDQRNVLVRDEQGRTVALEGIVTDVTSRKTTELTLQESGERFRQISELITDIAYSCARGPDGLPAINWITGAGERITGYTNDEIKAMSCWKFLVLEEDIPLFERSVTGLSPGQTASCELRIRRKDGKVAWIASYAKCLGDTDGPGAGTIYGGLRDVTRWRRDEDVLIRKTTELQALNEKLSETGDELRRNYEVLTLREKTLRESEERYRLIVETAEEGIWQMDEEAHTTFVNRRMAEMLGYTQVEMVGKPISSFMHKDDYPDHELRMRQRREGVNEQYERRFVRKDGSVIWALISVTALKNRNDEFKGSFAMISDITARKRAEDALKESEDRYRTLAETAQDLIYIIDRDDNVIYANGFALEIIGKSLGDIVGKPRRVLFPGPTTERQYQNLQKVLSTGKPLRIESTVPVPGREIWQDTQLVPVRDASGEITSVLGISRDISRLKKTEEALRASNAKLNLMTSIVRHDIINQVSVLMGFISLLKSDTIDPAKKEEYLASASEAGERISRIIAFSKEYQQIGVTEPGWHNLHDTVVRAADEVGPTRVTVINAIPGDIVVRADPLILKVFYNLIDNANRHGGTIDTVSFSAVGNDGDLLVTCEDDGVGIDPREKNRIFERGYGRNTGLGLFLARDILAITGITLTETGEAGKGARFEMRVPKDAWKKQE